MTSLPALLRSAIAVITLAAFSSAALAQVPPEGTPSIIGTHEILTSDGVPVSPGNTITLECSNQGGTIYALVKFNGVLIPDETATMELISLEPVTYMWVNQRGTFGMTTWNEAGQYWDDIVMTGPHAGRHNILCPR